MSQLSNLAYAVLEVANLQAWRSFASEILGLQVVDQDGGLALRMDQYAYRFLLKQGPADDLLCAGWELSSEPELEAYVASVRAAGGEVSEAPERARARRVEKLYVCRDPNGFEHEFFFGPNIPPLAQPFVSDVVSRAGFKTGPLGLGHILPASRDYQVSTHFYKNVLGLKVSDYIRADFIGGAKIDATFFHSATGRHHSLATSNMPSAKILNHFMIEVEDINDVGLAYDRAVAAGVPILLELGHHPNDGMFSFYMISPSGFAVEVGFGGTVIDDATWKVVTYSQLSDWGHRRNPVQR